MDATPSSIRGRIQRARNYVLGAGLGPFLVRAAAGSAGVRVAAMVASFAVGVQLARGLGVEGFGYYSMALAIVTMAAIPAELGLPILVIREVAAAASQRDHGKLFGLLRWADRATLTIAVTVALAVIAGALIVYRTGPPALAGALLLGAPVIPLIALAKVRGGVLQGLNHVVRGQVPANLLRPIIFSLLLFVPFLAGVPLGAPLAMALNSVAAAAVLLVAYAWLKQRLPAKVTVKAVPSGRQLLSSSFSMGLMEGMRVLQIELSMLLVGLIAAPAVAGLLRIASVTSTIAAAAITVISFVVLPVMARLHAQKDHQRLQKTVTGVAHSQFAGVLIMSLPLIIFPEPLISLAFGSSYAPAADALRIFALGQIANAVFGPNIWLLNMTHHERRAARAMGIGLILSLVLVPPLTLQWGVSGAAFGLAATMFCWQVIGWWDARKLLGIETSIAHWPWRYGEFRG